MPRQVTLSLVWRRIPVVPVRRQLRQEDYKFKNSLGSIARLCLHTNKGNKLEEYARSLLSSIRMNCLGNKDYTHILPLGKLHKGTYNAKRAAIEPTARHRNVTPQKGPAARRACAGITLASQAARPHLYRPTSLV